MNSLAESQLGDIDYVSSEVCSHIESMVSNHDEELNKITDKFGDKHKQTLVCSFVTSAIVFMPSLSPLLGRKIPFALAAKYGKDKWEELKEKKQLSQSLMGVFALAKHDS